MRRQNSRDGRASVHTAERLSCKEAMPPQARRKSPCSGSFIAGRARRVVGCNHVDRAIAQRLPQLFAILALADGRSALEFGGAVGDFFGSERQVMRASLGGNGKAFGFCLAQQLERRRRKKRARCAMRALNSRLRLTRSAMASSLRRAGTRSEPGGVPARRCGASFDSARRHLRSARAVRHERAGAHPARRVSGNAARRSRLGDMRKFVDAAGHQKTFESEYARLP